MKKRKARAKGVPYENATTGVKAREEIIKLLRGFGCDNIAFIDRNEKRELGLASTHRGRQVQLLVSARGWAQVWLKVHPWNYARRATRQEHELAALRQGLVAVNSILRDWVKAQVTAVECGVLSFEAAFMPHMLTHDGRPLIERVAELLPEATEPKVVALPRPQ
jgi:hypothetical protein